MLLSSLLILLVTPHPAQDGVPAYFVKFFQERTLFAADEPVWLTIRLGNQSEKSLKSKKFPNLLDGLRLEKEGQALVMSKKFTSEAFYQKLRGLKYGAHRDFRLNLKRYFPDMQPGGVYQVSYHGPNYDLEGKTISLANIPLPDLEADYVVDTSFGEFVIKLDYDQTPNHSRNFAILTAMQFYQDMVFHRVKPGFVIQTGDPLGTGKGGSGYPMMVEESPFLKHKKYAVGMARSNALDSATSQFYVCLDRQKDLDEGYTVFAKVVDGFDVVDAIGKVPTTRNSGSSPNRPLTDVVLYSVKIKKVGRAP